MCIYILLFLSAGESGSEASNATGDLTPNLGFRDLQGAQILKSPQYTLYNKCTSALIFENIPNLGFRDLQG